LSNSPAATSGIPIAGEVSLTSRIASQASCAIDAERIEIEIALPGLVPEKLEKLVEPNHREQRAGQYCMITISNTRRCEQTDSVRSRRKLSMPVVTIILTSLSMTAGFHSTAPAQERPAQQPDDRGLKPSSPSLARSDYEFKQEPLRAAIARLADDARLNVVFNTSEEELIGTVIITMALKDTSSPRGLDVVLGAYGLNYVPLDTRTILVTKKKSASDGEMPITSLVLKAEIAEAEWRAHGNTKPGEMSRFDVEYFGQSLYSAILTLGQKAGLKILFDLAIEDTAKQTSIGIHLADVTVPGALTFILDSYDLKYDQVGPDTIIIVDSHHQCSSMPLGDIIKGLEPK